jgi:hypothetical protein
MNTRLIKSIPQLAKAGLNTQAVDLINVVKASFDIPQEYKDHVNSLPPHFVEMMYNSFRDACYEACDAGFQCKDKAVTLQKIELTFTGKAQKALEVLSDTAGLFESFRKAIDMCYECGLQEGGHETVLEKSLKDKDFAEVTATTDNDVIQNMIDYVNSLTNANKTALVYEMGILKYVDQGALKRGQVQRATASTDVTASIENDTIQNIIDYVNSLNNANKTALVYEMGILKYVDALALQRGVVQRATASMPTEEVVVPVVPIVEDAAGMGHDNLVALPTDEQKEEIAEKTVENNAMVGIYSIPVLFHRVESIMKSHHFSSDTEVECEVVDTLVDNISSLTIDEVCQIASDKLLVDCSKCNNIENLLDCLDNQADEINKLLGIPATVIFLVKDNSLTLSACFSKFDVAKMLESNPDNAVTQVVGSHGRTQNPITLSTKREIECLARMNSLSGVKMKDLKKGAPRMAQYVSALVSDFRTGKICAWSMAKSVRKSMADLVENCYGEDAKLYYEHLKDNKTEASVDTKALAGYIYSDADAMTVVTLLQDYLDSLGEDKLNEVIEQVGYGA